MSIKSMLYEHTTNLLMDSVRKSGATYTNTHERELKLHLVRLQDKLRGQEQNHILARLTETNI